MRPATWTLRSKLVASTVALFLTMTVATGVVTVLALNGFLMGQLDNQLMSQAHRVTDGGGRPGGGGGPGPGSGDLGTEHGALPPGLGGGFLHVELTGSSADEGFVVTPSQGPVKLTESQLSRLEDAGIGSRPATVDLGGSTGAYRLVATQRPSADGASSTTLLTGLPVGPQRETVARLSFIVVIATAFGLIAVAAAGSWLVRRNLLPLERVAATATKVSHLPLDSGAVALAERVPAEFTDERTEVGQVGSALNGLLDHVGEALNARHDSEMRVRQFVADASHELRTPLASIRGYAELSRRAPEPVPPSVAHALGRVESEAQRMTELVEDLLLLARLDAGRPLEREPVDLTRLVVDAVSDAHAAGPDHVWQLDVPEDAVNVSGDSARLHQIVANLLANARTHTPPGTTVRTSVAETDGEVSVTVEDNGPGIPDALQPNVFQRFARGEASRSRAAGSTGLGLSIVHAVTLAHGGRVDLSSKPGQTVFRVALPAH
ncbi:HAMP domain-containing sensor histidine kinase [Oryzihumus leptocrescens]